MTKALLRIGLGLSILYALLCLLIFLFQRHLLYFPDRSSESDAIRRAQAHRLDPWRDERGRLMGWRMHREAPAPMRVLVFHGNAGNALDRAYYLGLFEGQHVEVVLFEYPGYGAREGEPTESGFVAEGKKAFERLRREGPVMLLGESLGSGVAVQIAAAFPEAVHGLLLVTPYARMTEVAAKHYPWLPVAWLMKDRWDSMAVIRSFSGPVAVVVAEADEVVGADQGQQLAQACKGPARVWVLPKATHNGLDLQPNRGVWPEMLAFLGLPQG
jgi:pimeloyl-ACP methyl ester carboxylesterase